MLAKLSSKISFFIGGFLIVSIALLLIRHFLEPRYLGYTKEHWLEVYGQDFSSRSGLKLAPLSADQREALEAFRFFKANGVSFLVEVASKDLNLSNGERSFITLNKLMPWNKPWKRQLSPYQDYLHEIISAKSLLMELGMPFSWAESHAEPSLKSTDPNRVSVGLNILACSTNQMDSVATYATEFLGHSDSAVHHFAQKTLAITGDHTVLLQTESPE